MDSQNERDRYQADSRGDEQGRAVGSQCLGAGRAGQGHDGRGEGDTDGSADASPHIEQRRCPPRSARAHAGEGGSLCGDEHLPDGKTEREHARPHPPEAGSGTDGDRQQRHSHRRAAETDRQVTARAQALIDQPARDLCTDQDSNGLWQYTQSGRECAQSPAVLQVQRHDVERAEEGHRFERIRASPGAKKVRDVDPDLATVLSSWLGTNVGVGNSLDRRT